MSNNYFQFKQFIVSQDKTAMKVGTDGVLLGSWAQIPNYGTILDIGAGTGVVSLMLAQRFKDAKFLGVDIEKNASEQTRCNFFHSPFSPRLDAMNIDFKTFAENSSFRFDAFVCNPPFFKNSLDSRDLGRNFARQDNYLNLFELFSGCKKLGKDIFTITIIFPYDRLNEILENANSNELYLKRQTNIYPKHNSKPNRVLIELSNYFCDNILNDLIIYENDKSYTDEFIDLVKDFYLNF